MNAAAKVAFGETAGDYSRFRAGFPDAFFDRAATVGVGLRGQRILDLGTGTGTLARGFAARGAAVTGLDPDGRMLAAARQLDTQARWFSADYVEAPAETTGQPDGAFDVVTAGQCWHWFDRPAAAAECRRILKPGGTLMIAHFDWLPIGDEQGGNVVAATEALIREHNPSWTMHGGTGLYPAWLTDLAEAGLRGHREFHLRRRPALQPRRLARPHPRQRRRRRQPRSRRGRPVRCGIDGAAGGGLSPRPAVGAPPGLCRLRTDARCRLNVLPDPHPSRRRFAPPQDEGGWTGRCHPLHPEEPAQAGVSKGPHSRPGADVS